MPKLVVFDLDGTLAESKLPLTSEMTALLAELLIQTRVAVISGGTLPQLLEQVVARLPNGANLVQLYLLPTGGAALYEFQQGEWRKIYEERLSSVEEQTIEVAMRAAAEETGLIDFSKPALYGERIENRGSEVSMSALGQHASIDEKRTWDPDHAKRRALQAAIAARLTGFSVGMGGLTTIDVTKEGIDKAYGIHQLCERLSISEFDSLYIGDELIAGGNDEAVFKTTVQTKSVKSPIETIVLIKTMLKSA